MLTRGKIVLFYPAYDGTPLSAPLCLLSLASPLIQAGFDVRILDSAVTPNVDSEILRAVSGAVCLGISVLTGPMIRDAIRVAKLVKRSFPDVPVIFGGWHPSLVPGQTLNARCVDIVARGQGEWTLLEVAERLSARKDLSGVQGLSIKDHLFVHHAPDRPISSLEQIPTAAFHLVDFAAYARLCGMRKLTYATSVGCPYACNYCTDMVVYERRFNALSSARVVTEVTELAQRYGIDEVALLDSNFPVDLRRAIRIAEGFLDARTRFRWTFQASTDFLCRMSDDEVRLLGESGVTHMGFGTESTSAQVLKLMNKRHQRVNEMYETARKAELGDIHVTFNLIFGYPGETETDRRDTLRTMSDIARRFWNVSFSPNIFTPYPGIPIWPQLKEMGLPEPQSLEEWADLPLGKNILPWLQGEELVRLRRMLQYFMLHNQVRAVTKRHPRFRGRVRRALSAPLRWRIRKNRYSFPWEIWLAAKLSSFATRRSLVTGQPLSSDIRDVC